MNVRVADKSLLRIEQDPTFTGGWSPGIVSSFRRRMQVIRAALDQRDLAAIRGNRFEKLKGKRNHQYSIRLNDQYRLILELEGPKKQATVVVIAIEDYH